MLAVIAWVIFGLGVLAFVVLSLSSWWMGELDEDEATFKRQQRLIEREERRRQEELKRRNGGVND